VATRVSVERRELGAEVLSSGVRFRVWAPKCRHVAVVLEAPAVVVDLVAEGGGYFSALVAEAGTASRYRYRLDGTRDIPDPCSRFQPDGPHGPSMVVDPHAYRWRDHRWPGLTLAGQVFYEIHVGAFTPEGTLDAAARELPELARLGITAVELMPLAEFPGRFNWGYDGVDLYAPSHLYGDAAALKRFVDSAHAVGVGVVLDVVYNHFGPDGNYLRELSDDYFTDRYENEWGDALNFDGPGSEEVRRFFIENACYWVREFHLDGLRLDATQQMFDRGPRHIVAELSAAVRAEAQPRRILLIGENEPQDVVALRPVNEGGWGLDAVWSDDFHHAARVALGGRREAYYSDYRGSAQELISSLKYGHLFQGQYYTWQGKPRGTRVTHEAAASFVFYLQNHDQVANQLRGGRLHELAGRSRARALTALLLLAPETPLLFMGQEFGSSRPFHFFADHREAPLSSEVLTGRKRFLAQFPSYAQAEAQAQIPDPGAFPTFLSTKLNLGERATHAADYALHRDLLALRRQDPVIATQDRRAVDGAVLARRALVLRFFGAGAGDRLLVLSLGDDLDVLSVAEPLLASATGRWRLVLSTEEPRYGGSGVVSHWHPDRWRVSADSAQVYTSLPTEDERK
jgi:maltooligosyltrehalose trehalohydrolase